jgi:hypothetical protein
MSPTRLVAALTRAYDVARQAQHHARASEVSAVERALCGALVHRFQAAEIDDIEKLRRWDDDYADAMPRSTPNLPAITMFAP